MLLRSILTIILFYIFVPLPINKAFALCEDQSWIVEFHSKRRAISCKSAASEIAEVFNSIIKALDSGRSVEIASFGEFAAPKNLKKNSPLNKDSRPKPRKLRFKVSRELVQLINSN